MHLCRVEDIKIYKRIQIQWQYDNLNLEAIEAY